MLAFCSSWEEDFCSNSAVSRNSSESIAGSISLVASDAIVFLRFRVKSLLFLTLSLACASYHVVDCRWPDSNCATSKILPRKIVL